MTIWVHEKCGTKVRQPADLGRSWCPTCEDYAISKERDEDDDSADA